MLRWTTQLCLLALLGCGHGHGDDEHSVHDHEDEQGHHDHHHGEVESVTVWSDTLELFAEHPPAVVGEEVAFLAHLTVLDGFEALDGATIRLTLEGPARLETEADMLRSGIYAPAVTPTVAGTYRGVIEVIAGGEGSVGGFEVVVHPDEASVPTEEAEEEHSHAEPISLLKEQQWRVPFATAFSTRGEIAPGVEVAGELGAPPSGMAHVHAPLAGRVMAGRGGFPTPGSVVEAGSELATLAPTPGSPEAASQAEAAVVDAEAELANARAASERAQRMFADQAIPERQVQEAARRLSVAEAALSAARRAQALYSTASRGSGRGTWRVTSPIGGVVDEVRVSPGEAVEANELLFRVIDPEQRWLTAFVPEAWAVAIRPESGVSFRLAGEARWRRLGGALVHVSSAVDERSRTVRATWAIDAPPPELRVGAAVRVSIPSGEAESGIVVPRAAVVEVDGRPVVYVQVEGESFEERSVRVGASDGARVVLLEGLDEGERVVTTGGYLVRLASTAGEGGGHAHGHPH